MNNSPASGALPADAPAVPEDVLILVRKYGDTRADDLGWAQATVDLVTGLRRWAAALASPQVAPAPEHDHNFSTIYHARAKCDCSLATPVQVAPPSQPAFWVRRHPDGVLTGEVLSDAQIEPVRRNSGGWLPLYVGAAPVAPQDDARDAARSIFPGGAA